METNIKNGTANNNNGSNKLCRCLHSYLAMFFLPVAILFAITGALYVFGITGDLNTKAYEIKLDKPLPRPLAQNIEAQEEVMVKFAKETGIEVPEGKAKKGKMGVTLGSATGYHLVLIPDADKDTATLQVNNPNLYFKTVMLHKAKCGVAFKVLGVGLGVVLIVLYITGVGLVLGKRSLRSKLLMTGLCGFIVMLIAGYLSL